MKKIWPGVDALIRAVEDATSDVNNFIVDYDIGSPQGANAVWKELELCSSSVKRTRVRKITFVIAEDETMADMLQELHLGDLK